MAEQNIQSWSLDTSLPCLQLFGVKVSPFYQYLPLKYWLLIRELLDLSSLTKTALHGQKTERQGSSSIFTALISGFSVSLLVKCGVWLAQVIYKVSFHCKTLNSGLMKLN